MRYIFDSSVNLIWYIQRLLLLLQIHPNPQFDAEAAANELRDSMKGLGNYKRPLLVILRFDYLLICFLPTHAQ